MGGLTLIAVSLMGAASYMPETVVDNDFFRAASGVDRHPMFRGTQYRHHMSSGETASGMATTAIGRLQKKLDLDLHRDVDALISNVTLPDIPFVGAGAAIVGKLGMNPKVVYDLHNGGCVSFLFMLDLARTLIQAGKIRNAILCNMQTAAGRVFSQDDNRKLPQSCVPGDGCGAVYVCASEANPIDVIITRTHGEYALDMNVTAPDGRDWWQPGESAFNIDFDEAHIGSVIDRGNALVPTAMYDALAETGLEPQAIDRLITNQPNRIFLRNWREALFLPEEAHIHTLPEHGNLFGAALPICLERGWSEGRLKPGQRLMMAGFSHAGDYSAAAIISLNSVVH
ncbi:hypothetical protein K1W69_03125 [Hoeflea sp. WL0058]|uniref:3-oxoacyl-ACP synthase n=1 Tax=Flavimaribacter sediminis TaxID=2865987 RepID=A0AAE2ZMP8_9HYPH|nr:3-oxoacyl-[acyl-carrier-protein] synthase III C-terminal domain-containing protein [Flavimaribacter sediminis]MBW8636167.1 hypothetical protein [Flavimaribacter sediminis]